MSADPSAYLYEDDPYYDDAFFARLMDDRDRSRANRGTKLPKELTQCLGRISGAFVRSWDDAQVPVVLRPADIQVCLPPDGLSVLIECKETREPRISFNRIDDYVWRGLRNKGNRQRRSLMLHALAGGLSVIAVQHVTGNQSRTWLIPFQLWEHLRRTMPRESIPLTETKRPTFHEVGLLDPDELFSALRAIRQTAKRLPIVDYRKERK